MGILVVGILCCGIIWYWLLLLTQPRGVLYKNKKNSEEKFFCKVSDNPEYVFQFSA